MPPLLQSGMFNPAALLAQVYQVVGPSYPPRCRLRMLGRNHRLD
jgi:hypothetical protein